MPKREGHQLDQIAEQQLALQFEEAREANAVWYYNRTMCQIYLPTDNFKGTEFRQDSGRYHLVVQSLPPLHVPWGIYPRGILSWACTEVVRNKKLGDAARTLHLGTSLADFMEKVSGSRSYSGGAKGNIRRFKRQLSSLFSSRIAFWIGDDTPDVTIGAGSMMQIGRGWNLMWHNRMVDQPGLVQSSIELSHEFFEDCLKSPPVDVRIIRGLWPNCAAFDTYTWLSYKAYVMNRRGMNYVDLPWSALKRQFGPNYATMKRFREKFLETLARVSLLYRDFEFKETEGEGMCFRLKHPSVRALNIGRSLPPGSTHT